MIIRTAPDCNCASSINPNAYSNCAIPHQAAKEVD